MTDSVRLYRNQCDALRHLPPDQFKASVLALWDYAMDETIPEDDPIVMAMWLMAKPLLDQRTNKIDNGKKTTSTQKQLEATGKQLEATGKQLEATGEQLEATHKQNEASGEQNEASGEQLEATQEQLEANGHRKEKEKEKQEIYINNKRESTKEKSGRFEPPTAPQVEQYCAENGYTNVDPQRFIDFYASKGWMVGANHMKDWKAAVRNWNRSQRQESTAKSKNRFNNFKQRDYDFTNLEKQLLGGQSS